MYLLKKPWYIPMFGIYQGYSFVVWYCPGKWIIYATRYRFPRVIHLPTMLHFEPSDSFEVHVTFENLDSFPCACYKSCFL